jgi:hypothetical protein
VRTKVSECHPGTGVCSDQFCGPAEMFGHPGISALEFAGEHQKASKTLLLKGKAVSITTTTTTSTSKRSNKPTEDQHTTELVSPQPPIWLGEISLQRRRRTFMNHTPRNFEMRSPNRTEFPQTVEPYTERHTSLKGSDETLRPGTSHQSACGQTTSSTSNEQIHRSALGTWMAKNSVEVNANAPVELDSKEVVSDMAGKSTPKNSSSRRNSFTSSLASRITVRVSPAHSSQEIHPHTLVERHQPSEKRCRRQTPYKIMTSSPKSINSRFSPLEPWVAHHRHHKTTSTVTDLPPQVEIDDIAEVSTFSAIQEYFDNQVSTRSAVSTVQHRSSSPPNIPLTSSPVETRTFSPPVELKAVFPAGGLEIFGESTPDLPPRSPARLHTPNRVRSKTVDADFESAAEGQYSPYDKPDTLEIPKRHGGHESVRPRQAGKTGPSTLGRMAPPILGHAALTATADLNDLSFYLKNTGPSDGGNPKKKPTLKKIFKVPRKKSLAARVGSVEGRPSKSYQPPPPPACAREMRTASGAKHLRIMVPTDTLSYDHTITLPVSLSNRRSRHISITWTDEMLNPLASAGLEHAISDFNAMGEESPRSPTTPRTPKRSPMTLTPVPVENHPLKSREEKTKARKLRDLEKTKRNTANTIISTSTVNDTTGGALSTPDKSPVQMRGSPMANVDERQEERPLLKIVRLQNRVILLQRQNTELAGALARMMGLEIEDGELEADVVLKTYNRLRFSRDTEWDDLVMGRN